VSILDSAAAQPEDPNGKPATQAKTHIERKKIDRATTEEVDGMSYRSSNVACVSVPGVNLSVLDYLWDAGECMTVVDARHILRWRIYPTEVGVAARLGPAEFATLGRLMYFPAGIEIQTDVARHGDRTRVVMCQFDPDWFGEVSPTPLRWDDEKIASYLDMKNPEIARAMQRLGMEALSPGFASSTLVESLATTIAVELSRDLLGKDKDPRVRTRDGELPRTHLERIYGYIDCFDNSSPSIDDIAKLCGISSVHLRRAFKNTTGQTVHQYVENVRLKKAMALLAETDLPLKEVSHRLGFADASTFSSAFKKSTGKTPSGYRLSIPRRI